MAKKNNFKDFITDDTLDLSLSNLQDVPVKEIAAYPKVTSLDLSNNKLVFLGNSFAVSLTHLVKLDLARNELKELPRNFGLLLNLKHLDLYKNRLQNIPLSFGNLKALKWIDLKENPLEPHWQKIVGPCLSAQDCKLAAKNVVNIASMMSDEIDDKVQKNQARQKQIEETELREQAKKKEKQREKKKRRNANKNAEANQKDVVNSDILEAEPLSNEVQDPSELNVKDGNNRIGIGKFILRCLSTIFFMTLYTVTLMALFLIILSFINGPIYKRIMDNLSIHLQPLMKLLPGNVRIGWHKFSTRTLNNLKYVNKSLWKAWQGLSKFAVNFYVFISSDPRVGIFFSMATEKLLLFYTSVCNVISVCFNNILNLQS